MIYKHGSSKITQQFGTRSNVCHQSQIVGEENIEYFSQERNDKLCIQSFQALIQHIHSFPVKTSAAQRRGKIFHCKSKQILQCGNPIHNYKMIPNEMQDVKKQFFKRHQSYFYMQVHKGYVQVDLTNCYFEYFSFLLSTLVLLRVDISKHFRFFTY